MHIDADADGGRHQRGHHHPPRRRQTAQTSAKGAQTSCIGHFISHKYTHTHTHTNWHQLFLFRVSDGQIKKKPTKSYDLCDAFLVLVLTRKLLSVLYIIDTEHIAAVFACQTKPAASLYLTQRQSLQLPKFNKSDFPWPVFADRADCASVSGGEEGGRSGDDERNRRRRLGGRRLLERHGPIRWRAAQTQVAQEKGTKTLRLFLWS